MTFEGLLLDELRRVAEAGLTPSQMRKWSHLGAKQTTRILGRLVKTGKIAQGGKHWVGTRYWAVVMNPEVEGDASWLGVKGNGEGNGGKPRLGR